MKLPVGHLPNDNPQTGIGTVNTVPSGQVILACRIGRGTLGTVASYLLIQCRSHMRRVLAILGSALFFVLAPGTVAGLVPWWISRWRLESPAIWRLPLRVIGGVLLAAGTMVLIDSFARFAIQGLGTPAPVFPTRHLVITGLYRYVRNPMYVAVIAVIVGQGLILANMRLLEYGVSVGLCFHLFVVAYEEPTLRATFGVEYEAFCRGVSRWLPRLRPWPGHNNPLARG